jgi:hypothetical protein
VSASDRYFQFPICALSYGTEIEDRLEAICSWSFIHAGCAAWDRMTREARAEKIGELVAKFPNMLTKNGQPREFAAMLGAEIVGVTVGGLASSLHRYDALSTHIQAHEKKHGADVQVRIRTDIFWDAKSGANSYREFAILCGLFSCIGNNAGAVCARIEMIGARAMGYKSPAIMGVELAKRKDKAKPFTRSQIRTTLDKLHALQFFSRCYPGDARDPLQRSRDTFYSNRLSNEQLGGAVLKRITYWKEFKARRATANAALKLKLDQRLNALSPIKVAIPAAIKVAISTPETSPDNHHAVATESPDNRQSVATIIETPSIEPQSIQPQGIQPQERDSARSHFVEKKQAAKEQPPTISEVQDMLASLFKAERFTDECMEAAPWKQSAKPWRQCVATWAANRISAEKRKAVAA